MNRIEGRYSLSEFDEDKGLVHIGIETKDGNIAIVTYKFDSGNEAHAFVTVLPYEGNISCYVIEEIDFENKMKYTGTGGVQVKSNPTRDALDDDDDDYE